MRQDHDDEQRRLETAGKIGISIEQFLEQWKGYAADAKEKGKQSLSMLMGANTPEMVETNTFKILVATQTLRETFIAEKMQIMDAMSEVFGTSNFEILVEVQEVEEKDKAKFLSTPREKYEHMVKINPELKKLMDDLGLDFNY